MLITSRQNKIVAHLRRLSADGAYRRECGEYVLDGDKLLREALDSGAKVRTVLALPGTARELPAETEVYEAGKELLQYASPLKNSPGPVFAVDLPVWEAPENAPGVIVLEGVQDPGNVGTVLRTADAFSIGAVVLAGACADPYGAKAARAAMGATFRVPVLFADTPDSLAGLLRRMSLRLTGTSPSHAARDLRSAELQGAAVAVGSEGRGLSDELLSLCGEVLRIPMSGGCESLNAAVAASLVMWEMSKHCEG